MGALHLTFTPKFPQNEGFQLQIWHFLQTFSDEKIFDNFSTVKNLGFATAPHHHHMPSCYDATASESNQIEIL